MKAFYLFTRDFRLTDNKSLEALAKLKVTTIIPIFIFTPIQFSKHNQYRSDNSLQLMIEGVSDLNSIIKDKINCYYGDTSVIIEYLLKKYRDIDYLGCNLDITPFGKQRSKTLEKLSNQYNIKYINEIDYILLPLDEIKTNNGTFYKTFSHYKNKVIQHSEKILQQISGDLSSVFNFVKLPNNRYSTDLQSMSDKIKINPNNLFLPFTRNHFLHVKISKKNLEKFRDYTEFRTYPKYQTTLFSAYLKYGLVSIREVYQAIYNYYGDCELLRQLIWREYYYYLMYHLPEKQTIGGDNMQKKIIKWENNNKLFHAWKNGNTGFPFIDACMTQLNTTGWMHNRARLCSANALVYLFKIDWRWGEKYFAERLADYDISQNNGNWQWCGGVGVDRKPYLRMYNPYTLSKKYDPDGSYVKKWVKQLKSLSSSDLNNYEKFLENNSLDKINYPKPIVDYQLSREKAKVIFR